VLAQTPVQQLKHPRFVLYNQCAHSFYGTAISE
jgi:hypothetical protein